MQPEEFIKQSATGTHYSRLAAIRLIEDMTNGAFDTLMGELAKLVTEKQYSPAWQRTDKIKYVLERKGPCRPKDVIAELERLEGKEYPLRERQSIHSTIGVLCAYGKLSKTLNHNERPLYSL